MEPSDMINEGASQKLTQYLRTTAPTYAILLRGPWGVGKSFYWRRFKERELEGLKKKDITFSVAGLATLEDLERSLFLASIDDLGNGLLKETGAVVGRALLRMVKVEPDDIKLKADVRSGETVVCIDDLERFAGHFKILFGFIVSLIDAATLHVVLIADEERAIEALDGYREYKERIISQTFEVRSDVDAFYEGTVKGYAHDKTRVALLDIKDHATALFKEKGLKNLRTIRTILDELNTLLSGVRWPEGLPASLGSLLSAVTFHVMAVSKNASNESMVGEIFLHGDLGTVLMFSRAKRKKSYKQDLTEDDNYSSLGELIDGLGFEADIYEWHGSKAYAAYVSGDQFDADQIASDFQLFGAMSLEGVSVLERFRSYRTMTEEDFRANFSELEEMIRKRNFRSLQHVWEAYEILDHLSKQKLISMTPEECHDTFIKLVGEIDPTDTIHPSFDVWPEKRNADQEAVLKALRVLEGRVQVENKKLDDENTRRAIIEGQGDEPSDALATPFENADPLAIYKRLLAAGRPGLNRMRKFFSRRFSISNIADFTRDDAPFAKVLADIIRSKIPATPPVSLDDASWLELLETLRRFVQVVSPDSLENTQPDESNP